MILVPRRYPNLQHFSDDYSETCTMEKEKNVKNVEQVSGARIAWTREKSLYTEGGKEISMNANRVGSKKSK